EAATDRLPRRRSARDGSRCPEKGGAALTQSAANGRHMARLGVRFIQWGLGLGVFGILIGFGIIGHYIKGAQYEIGHEFLHNVVLWFACPWTLSVYAIQLGSLGMIVFGLTYLVVGRMDAAESDVGSGSAELWWCVAALIGIFCTGYAGYFVVDVFWPEFYYKPVKAGKDVWLLAQLACIVCYFIGAILVRARAMRMLRALR